tara:strand:+ start:511 stop:1380 length:870 start_codon:yes stop_codon:yes gene_type:complete
MSVNNLIGHKVYLNNLEHLYKENKLPNKILLSGYKGIGKALLVKNFLYKVFDDDNSHVLINNNSHPNILNIKKKDDKKIIEIDQIREIIKFTNQSSFNNKSRFIVIDDVEYLNISSSNALLKSLEEPNFNVNFFLVYNSNLKILDTIKSRCIEIKINLNQEDTKLIVNKYFDDEVYENINDSLSNFYSTPNFLILLVNYLKENDLSLVDTNINVLIRNIIVNKHYNKNIFVKDYLNYIIELFFYNHINITKEISYKVKEYYYTKLLNIRKFNLDYETFFLEFEDNLLNG